MFMTMKTQAGRLCWTGGIALAIGAATAAVAQRGSAYSYQSGQELYEHICQGCHMPGGKGAVGAGAYPALANNAKLKAGLYPVVVILRGQKAMPSFSELDDAQIAAVTNYIRTNFGNAGPGAVTADQVKTLRTTAVNQKALAPG
jgi:mono/diheme cytochrome c family protein